MPWKGKATFFSTMTSDLEVLILIPAALNCKPNEQNQFKAHALTCTGKRSELLLAMQIKFRLQSCREVTVFDESRDKTPLGGVCLSFK